MEKEETKPVVYGKPVMRNGNRMILYAVTDDPDIPEAQEMFDSIKVQFFESCMKDGIMPVNFRKELEKRFG